MRGTLKSRQQFLEVYEKGLKAVGRHVVAFALPREGAGTRPGVEDGRGVGLGVVASRKVGHAVDRNRAKRLLRAAASPLRERVRERTWIVLVARRSLIEEQIDSHALGRELEELLQQMKALEKAPASSDSPGS